jgi:hypothetical protein
VTSASQVPRRALIVSADISEGHNAAGRAIEEAIGRIWPGCQVGWLDALDAMGPGFARLARAFYVAQVQVIVACGRNDDLRRQLNARGEPPGGCGSSAERTTCRTG